MVFIASITSIPNVLRQSLNLISQFPMLMVYGYLAYNYKMGEDLYICLLYTSSKTSTGLGLSIAKELVKRMNGEISAKTEKNEFIIEMRFPLSI